MNPPKGKGPKILLLDFETFPLLGYAWEVYEANILKVVKPPVICCYSAKWLGGKQITKGLCDYEGYCPKSRNNKAMVREIWNLANVADIIIAQNGDNFDVKWMNTEFIRQRLTPPSPYKTVDSLKVARSKFRFPSNKLDDLGAELHEGRKIIHEGKELWFGCEAGDMKKWKKMKRYNAQDVLLLERVYKRFIPWITNHPNYGAYADRPVCPNCGENRLHIGGYKRTLAGRYVQYQCQNCGRWCHDSRIEKKTNTLRNA